AAVPSPRPSPTRRSSDLTTGGASRRTGRSGISRPRFRAVGRPTLHRLRLHLVDPAPQLLDPGGVVAVGGAPGTGVVAHVVIEREIGRAHVWTPVTSGSRM